MHTVYLSEYIHPQAQALLRERAKVVDTFQDLEHLDGIILRNVTVDRELMEKAPNLRVVGKHGVGCNTIDLEAAAELGVQVIYTPTCNINSVAELLAGMILSAARGLTYANTQVRRDRVQGIAPKDMIGMEISGKTLGLIGMGNISRRLAEILRDGFGVSVVGYDPYVTEQEAAAHRIQKLETVREVLQTADIVNVSVPLTNETRNLISGELFHCFKPGAILVNASRGGIVHEDDLYQALAEGRLGGAACDVFAQEPPTSANKLLSLDGFCATPHIGGNTQECLYRTGMEIVEETLLALDGGQPAHPAIRHTKPTRTKAL